MMIKFFLLFLTYSTLALGAESGVVEEGATALIPINPVDATFYDTGDGTLALQRFSVDSVENNGLSKTLSCFVRSDGRLVDTAGHEILIEGIKTPYFHRDNYASLENNQVFPVPLPVPEGQDLGEYIASHIQVKPQCVQHFDDTRDPPLLLSSRWSLDFSIKAPVHDPEQEVKEEREKFLFSVPLYPSPEIRTQGQARLFVGQVLKDMALDVSLSLTLGGQVRLRNLEPFYQHEGVAAYIAERISTEFQPTKRMKDSDWKSVVAAIAEDDNGALHVLYQPGFIKTAVDFAIRNQYWGSFALLVPLIASIRIVISDQDHPYVLSAKKIVLQCHKTAHPWKWRWNWIKNKCRSPKKQQPPQVYRSQDPVAAEEAVPAGSIQNPLGPSVPPVHRPDSARSPRPSAPPLAQDAAVEAFQATPPPVPPKRRNSSVRSFRSMLPNDAVAQAQKVGEAQGGSGVLPGVPVEE